MNQIWDTGYHCIDGEQELTFNEFRFKVYMDIIEYYNGRLFLGFFIGNVLFRHRSK